LAFSFRPKVPSAAAEAAAGVHKKLPVD